MKRSIVTLICLFYVISNLPAQMQHYFGQLSIGGQHMIELQNKISGSRLTVDEMYRKYGEPQCMKIQKAFEPDFPFPDADSESRITRYYYDEIGDFLFYFNGSLEFLMLVTVNNNEFIKKLEIPLNKTDFIKYYGEGNDKGDVISYGYREGYLYFYFTFENHLLIEIQISTGI